MPHIENLRRKLQAKIPGEYYLTISGGKNISTKDLQTNFLTQVDDIAKRIMNERNRNGTDYMFKKDGLEFRAWNLKENSTAVSFSEFDPYEWAENNELYFMYHQINSLREDNWSISDIMKETGLSRSSVHSYLPYTKVIYNAEELSLYAQRCRTYRKRKQAVKKLQSCMGESIEILEEILWNTIKVFSGYFFETAEGKRFCYNVSGDEILVLKSRESITRVDVTIALKEILKLNGVVESLQNMKVPGAGYLYPVFLRFGLIRRKGESDGHLSDMDNIQ